VAAAPPTEEEPTMNAFLAKSARLAMLLMLPASAFAADILWPSFQWGEPNNAPVMTMLKEKFEQENPGTVVKSVNVPLAAFWDKQFADVASGNAPEIVTMYDPDVRAFIEADLLEPLDSYLGAAGIDMKTLVPTERLAQKNGKTYAIPFQINARALFYNEKLFKDAGVAPPKNIDEMTAAIRKLRNVNAQQFGYATVSKPGAANLLYIEIMPIVAGFGGGFFKDGKPSANSPQTVAALKFIKMLYDDELIPRGMDTQTYRQLFVQGKVAMYATGGFFASVVNNGNKETFANLRAEPLPLPSGNTMSITVFLGVPKAAKNKDQAARLLMRMLKEDMQAAIVNLGRTHPGRIGMIPASFTQENPWFKAFEQATLTAKSYAPEGVEQYGNEIVKVVAENVEAMLFNNIPAETAANNLQKALTDFMATKKP
jgi:ABC-type glycerol-3-phosphate transport system substrate-binding protein